MWTPVLSPTYHTTWAQNGRCFRPVPSTHPIRNEDLRLYRRLLRKSRQSYYFLEVGGGGGGGGIRVSRVGRGWWTIQVLTTSDVQKACLFVHGKIMKGHRARQCHAESETNINVNKKILVLFKKIPCKSSQNYRKVTVQIKRSSTSNEPIPSLKVATTLRILTICSP